MGAEFSTLLLAGASFRTAAVMVSATGSGGDE